MLAHTTLTCKYDKTTFDKEKCDEGMFRKGPLTRMSVTMARSTRISVTRTRRMVIPSSMHPAWSRAIEVLASAHQDKVGASGEDGSILAEA